MSKRKPPVSRHTSMRLAPEVMQAAISIGSMCEWSIAHTITHLARIGIAIIGKRPNQVRRLADDRGAAATLAIAKRKAAKIMSDARKSLRPARSDSGAASSTPASKKTPPVDNEKTSG